MNLDYDAIVVVSFGGPEGPDDVLPFLENVLRGRGVPVERMLEVAEHYHHFGGVSPINRQNRDLIASLRTELDRHGPRLPIYWGNRNWQPLLSDTVREMRDDGIQRALALVTSTFSSYSGCRQYLENIESARQLVGPSAPQIDKLRSFYNHPGFVSTMTELLAESLRSFPPDAAEDITILFSAHSIPATMAATCAYQTQLQEASRLIAKSVGEHRWEIVFQSRSGAPGQSWLEPDIGERLRALASAGVRRVVVVPIGFVSDHMEVLYDLDYEAQAIAAQVGIHLVRCPTVGTHPGFIAMIRELILERCDPQTPRRSVGNFPPPPDQCPPDCCAYAVVRQKSK